MTVDPPTRTPGEAWRRHRLRQVMLFVTVPGVLLGSASITAAYAAGLMHPAAQSPTCSPVVVTAPAPGSFTVNVMNATGRNGVAGQVGAALRARTFIVAGISSAPESWYVTQAAVVHHGAAGLDQALLTASQFPGARLFADARTGTSVDVVIGVGYERLGPPPTAVSGSSGTEAVVTITRPCP